MANVDPKTLTEQQIKDAIYKHCEKMGSKPYYAGDEIEYWRKDPDGLVVFTDTNAQTGETYYRAYHRRERKA